MIADAVPEAEFVPATLPGLIHQIARARPDDVALQYLDDAGTWMELRCRQLAYAVAVERRVLVERGIRAGDRVAILGDTGPSWIIADLAAVSAGAITVPVYPTSSSIQVQHLLGESGAVLAYGETDDQRALLRTSAGHDKIQVHAMPANRHVHLDQGGDGHLLDELSTADDLVDRDALATIVYTSGTTGDPKGCMLTHRNLLSGVTGVVRATECVFSDAGRTTSTLVCLPLAHIYARTTVLGTLMSGARAGLLRHPSHLTEVIGTFRPTFLAITPHLLGKLADLAESAPDAAAALGGHLRHIICGGAPVDARPIATLAAAGVVVLPAYGMTETSSAAAINRPSDVRPGTVGQAIPGTIIDISDSGEILVSGANASPGYWTGKAADRYPHSAGRVIATGDLGTVDDDGFLVVTGRLKDILITSSGKNVAPGPLEERIRAHPLVSNCVVVGEGRPYVAALITLAPTELQNIDPAEARTTSEVIAQVQEAVDRANEVVSRAESIRRFRLLTDDFTVENQQLTASLKLRRDKILADHADVIDELYAAPRSDR